MWLVSSVDENRLDLLDHSWLDSVPHSKQRTHTYTHSKSGSCNEIPFVSGGICPWVQGLSGHCEALSNIWQHTRQSFFDCVHVESCRKEIIVGWIGGHAGTSNRGEKKKPTGRPVVLSLHLCTLVTHAQTQRPWGLWCSAEVIIVITAVDTKAHTGTLSLKAL